MHDTPYLKGAVGPEISAAMTAVARAVKQAAPLPCGVQVLAGANRSHRPNPGIVYTIVYTSNPRAADQGGAPALTGSISYFLDI